LPAALYEAFGFDPATMRTPAGSLLAATPMAHLRDLAVAALEAAGLTRDAAATAIARQWQPPDPVALARPLAPLRPLFRALRRRGHRIAVATTDDREPTERTLASLGVEGLIEAVVCADDGIAVKPGARAR